jgi:hypothetical protein
MIGWQRAAQMARALVSYIPDDKRVLHEVRSVFNANEIDLETVKAIRRARTVKHAAFRRRAEEWTEDREDPLHNQEYQLRQEAMARANERFVKALRAA